MLLILVEIKHPGGCVRFSISQTDDFEVLLMWVLSYLDDVCVGLDNFFIKMSSMSFVLPRFFFRYFLSVPLLEFVWLYGTDPGDR